MTTFSYYQEVSCSWIQVVTASIDGREQNDKMGTCLAFISKLTKFLNNFELFFCKDQSFWIEVLNLFSSFNEMNGESPIQMLIYSSTISDCCTNVNKNVWYHFCNMILIYCHCMIHVHAYESKLSFERNSLLRLYILQEWG